MSLVLVVEDELPIAKLLEDVFTDEGYRVMIAGNGKRAIELAMEEAPDVVLSDFMMPVMDGASFVRAMAGQAALKDIPIILMSSLPEAVVAERCAGYACFIRKPFNIFDVVRVVSGYVPP